MSDSSSNLKFPCPGCFRNLSAGPELFGQTVECPNCGVAVQVPTHESRPEPAKTVFIGADREHPPTTASSVASEHPGHLSSGTRLLRSLKRAINSKVGVAVLILLLGFAFLSSFFSELEDHPGSEETSLKETEVERAENITYQMVSESLKSPSTASFMEFRVIDREGPFFQTYTGVDAQNGFGALVRSYFVCVFKLDEDSRFSTHRLTAVQEVGSFDHRMFKGPSVPEQEAMDFQKHCIGWPGYESNAE